MRGLSRTRPRSRVTLGLRRSSRILVVPPHPIHDFSLVAAFRREVEKVVGAEQQIAAARVGRVGMKHFAILILIKDAEARQLVGQVLLVFDRGIIVVDLALHEFRLRERHVTVIIEVAALGR